MSVIRRGSSHLESEYVIDVAETKEVLGQGAYCVTVKVKYGHTLCAAKQLHSIFASSSDEASVTPAEAKFRNACKLFSTLRHPNIVQFIGISYLNQSKSPSIVMELLDTDLRQFLERQKSDIPLWIKYSILLDVAHGIEYLHSRSPCVIHRDISSKCILLDKNLTAKIGDFITARTIPTAKVSRRMSAGPGSFCYAAPETRPRSGELALYSSSIDIFSFGCVALETLLQSFPDLDKRRSQIETLQRNTAHALSHIVISCLQEEPDRRPTAGEVCNQLKRCRGVIPGEDKSKLELILEDKTPAPSGRGQKQERAAEEKASLALRYEAEVTSLKLQLDRCRNELQQHSTVQAAYREDFEAERRDRERMANEKASLALRYEAELTSLKLQLDRCRNELQHHSTAQVSGDLVQQLLREQTELQGALRKKEENIKLKSSEIAQLQHRLQHEATTNAHLEQQLAQVTDEKQQLHLQLTSDKEWLERQLSHSNRSREQLEQQIVGLRKLLSAQGPKSENIEFWQVSREEVTLDHDQELGRGGWGVVVRGKFRGKEVAVKCIHQENLTYQRGTILERFRREILMMAKLRHPNLVLFMAAVLDDLNDPPIMIVTEILETTLRKIVEKNRVGKNKLSILREVASALLYLHQHKQEIIHRDVSTANVLVCASVNGTWTAKLSDFGSANLARIATTLGDGALVYTAPEAYPQPTHPHSPPPPPQTTKIDVYSFGVLTCEVITHVFPDPRRLAETVRSINRVWPEMYHMVNSCVEYRPEGRPTMVEVLAHLNELKREP